MYLLRIISLFRGQSRLIQGISAGLAVAIVLPLARASNNTFLEPQNWPLQLPTAVIHEQLPQSYTEVPPGEYKDVDLPDEIRAQKYPQILLAEANTGQDPLASDAPPYSIQVGMFKHQDNAQRLKQQLEKQHLRVTVTEKNNSQGERRYFVRIGHYQSREQAEAALQMYNRNASLNGYITEE